jgi:hypothetical protein
LLHVPAIHSCCSISCCYNYGDAIKYSIAGQRVDCAFRQNVAVYAGMNSGHGHPEFLMAVAPAVRQAHHTRHNVGADFDRRLDSAGASGDAGETALAQAKTFGIKRMKQDGAAVASLYQGRNIMQPGITGADMPPADQDMPPGGTF